MAIAKCIAIYLSYTAGGFLTGLLHQETQLMGSMLAAISSIVVLQADVKTSIRQGWLRVLGTFIGAVIAYIYLTLTPFSVVGMVACAFILEILCMMIGIPDNGRMATITLVVILVISKKSPDLPPLENGFLRFSEASIGAITGITLAWLIQFFRDKFASKANLS